MNGESDQEEIAASLKQLAVTYLETARQLEATIATLSRVLKFEYAFGSDTLEAIYASVSPPSSGIKPVAERATFSVVFRDKACFLGNTLLFRFFEALARRPNRFFAYSELLTEVWGAQRAESSIRNVVMRLREHLIRSGMAEVAKAIDGSTPGHFVLRLPISE